MATAISSTFDIVIELAAGQTTTNVANPGRAFRVVGIYGTGVDTAVLTVSKVDSGGGATSMGVVTIAALVAGLDDAPAVLATTATDRDVARTDTLRLVRSVADSTRCVIRCTASGGGEALTES